MSKAGTVVKVGPGALTLTLILAVLKSMHYIDWPWYWIACPLWLPLLVLGVFIGVVLLIGLLGALLG